MKPIIFIPLFLLFISCDNREKQIRCETIRIVEEYYPEPHDKERILPSVKVDSSSSSSSGRGRNGIYICTGKGASTYHTNDKCSGMSNCKGSVKQITLSKARSMGRRLCKRCDKSD